jgi:hypothetical protein
MPLPTLVSAKQILLSCRLRLKRDGTRAETRFRLSPKRTSPFKSAGASVQSTAGSRGVRVSGSNAVYTMFRGSVRVLATHSIRQFPLHFPSHASPCAIRFQTHSNTELNLVKIIAKTVSDFIHTGPADVSFCSRGRNCITLFNLTYNKIINQSQTNESVFKEFI